MSFEHVPVMLQETIDGLDLNPNGVYVDCTLGGGNHASYLLDRLSAYGRLYAFDQDIQAIDHARDRFAQEIKEGRLVLIHSNFRNLRDELATYQVHLLDGIYYDLGVSSPQLDQADRGFSYQQDAPLDMRMDQGQALTAWQVVNQWEYSKLVRILSRYGEEKFAKRIARHIEQSRQRHTIERTSQLAEIIKEAIPAATRRTGGHPAKRSFQAIRIAVNDELGALEESLDQGLKMLKVQGRMAVISFHSLEDRLVKQVFMEKTRPVELPRNLPVLANDETVEYQLITRKPIVPSEQEVATNNRARSAKLRIIERRTFQEG